MPVTVVVVFGLVSVIVRVDVPPEAIVMGEKSFVEAMPPSTVSVAFAAPAVPALAVVTGPVVLL